MNTNFSAIPRRHFLPSAAFGTFAILVKSARAAERPRVVARLGGGMVRVLPGSYRLRNAIHLASRVRLAGSGVDTVLLKEPSVTTKLAADSDWYEQEITLADATGFRVGDGVCLKTQNKHKTGPDYCKRTLITRSGNRFQLDRPLRENFCIPDSGGERGVGVDVEGATEHVAIVRNEIRETRAPLQRVGIRLGAETSSIKLEENQFSGLAREVEQMKAAATP